MVSEGLVDVNFACALELAQKGEGSPYAMADLIAPPDMLAFLRGGARAMDAAREAVENLRDRTGPDGETILYSPSQLRPLAPLPDPPSLRDFFAFEQHVKMAFGKFGEAVPPEWHEIPVYSKIGTHRIIGTGAGVDWPCFTERFDYGLELAAVIGRPGRNVSQAKAGGCVAGYMVMNGFSARDIERREMKVRLGPAKGRDWCTALGPWLVTPDEVGDPYGLEMIARVNGEEWSRGNSGSMYWSFEEMIEFLTRDDSIAPGDVLGSGVVGTGCGLELDRWVRRGDIIELEIEKLGILRNRVG